MKKYLILILALCCSPTWADEHIAVLQDVQGPQTAYLAKGKSCELAWLVTHRAQGFGVRQDSSRCALPPSSRLPYWDALLNKLVADGHDLQGMLAFHLNPLKQGEADNELSLRLMRALANSKEWDKKRGVMVRHPREVSNLLVKKSLTNANVFAELNAAFAKYHFRLQVLDVEEVLIQTTELEGFGKVRVPYNCLVSFSVTPIQPEKP